MSGKAAEKKEKLAKLRTWLIVFLMAFWILTYGIITYVTVGDKGPPGWRYGAVKDVPGESPFAMEPMK